jgi:hypothetical protein
VSNVDSSLPPSGPTLTQALKSLVAMFDSRSIRYAIIEGIATLQHTRIRTTDDVDVLLTVPQIAMPAMFDALEAAGFKVELPKNIQELRDDGLTTIQFGDVLIDLMRPVLPLYSHVLDRAVATNILGQTVRVSSVDGLIVMKLVSFRPQDQADIRDLIDAYRGRLDLDYIRNELATVAERDDARWAKLEAWINNLQEGSGESTA